MTSEKESLDQPPSEKPARFHPPTLVSSGGKSAVSGSVGSPRSDSINSSSAAAANNGYYQNVTQKGKLILPTAIWILLIVGGLCFLSLLSSLNKTINSLDELIEFEQSKSTIADYQKAINSLDEIEKSYSGLADHQHKNNDHNAHNKHHHQNHHEHSSPEPSALSGRLTHNDDPDASESSAAAPRPHRIWPESRISSSSSWFAMPPSTSLDRTDFLRNRPNIEPSVQSMIDNMIRAANDNDKSGPISEGSIIIASSSGDDLNLPFGPPMLMGGRNPIESMIDQFLSAGSGPASNSIPSSSSSSSSSSLSSLSSSKGEPNIAMPAITANIDKINININNGGQRSPPDNDDQIEVELSMTKGNKKLAPIRLADSRRDELEFARVKQDNGKIESLAQSIDSLMAKLIAGPPNSAPKQQIMMEDRIMPSSGQLPPVLLSQMDFGSPSAGPAHHHHGPGHHHHHMGRPYLGQQLAAAADENPTGLGSSGLQAMLDGGNLPLPQGSQFIIALDNGLGGVMPSGPPRGPPFSPYELITEQRNPHHRHHNHRHPHLKLDEQASSMPPESQQQPQQQQQKLFEMLGNPVGDEKFILKSLAHSLLPMQQENKQQESSESDSAITNENMPSESVVFINGQPLISDKKQSLAMDEESLLKAFKEDMASGSDNNKDGQSQKDIKDLFAMFFGPPPSSEMVAGPASTPPPTPKGTTTTTTAQQQQQEQQGSTTVSSQMGEPEQKTSEQPSEAPLVLAFGDNSSRDSKAFDLSDSVIPSGEPESVSVAEPTKDDPKSFIGLAPIPSPSGAEQPNDLERIMEGLMGDLFTSAQFKNDQSPMQVEAQSSGGRQESPETPASTGSPSTPNSSAGTPEMKELGSLGAPKEADETATISSSTTSTSTSSTSEPNSPITTSSTTVTTTESSVSATNDLAGQQLPTIDWLQKPTSTNSKIPLEERFSPKEILDKETAPAFPMPQSTSFTNEPSSTPTPVLVPSTTTGPSGVSSSSPIPMTTVQPSNMASTTQKPAPTNATTSAPFKTFLQKADDFIGRNLMSLRRLLL